jgi:succinate-acetate transporter protein
VLVALIVTMRAWHALVTATRMSVTSRPRRAYAPSLRLMLRAIVLAPWVWAFLWVLFELAMAYSPSTSTLLLVTYFASTAVTCVAVGRARRAPRLRHVGLALALVAAATAVYGASSYFDPGARIVAYLVTSAFLLGIAYWYRRPGGDVIPA